MVMQQFAAGSGQGFKIGNRWHVGALQGYDVPATDYWGYAANTIKLNASTAVGADAAMGFVATSVVFTNTATGDFLSAADETPANFSANATADKYYTPIIFGDGPHARYVQQTLGYLPTKLCAEFYAQFATASANEAATLIGFHDGTAAVASIYSGGTASTFFLSNSVPATDAGAAIDTSWHLWKIAVVAATTEWFIDGVSQGTVATSADKWPAAFGWVASTTNRPALAWYHIWYE